MFLAIMTWVSHGGDYEVGCLTGCSAVKTGVSLPTIIALTMEAVGTSVTSANSYQSTQRYSP